MILITHIGPTLLIAGAVCGADLSSQRGVDFVSPRAPYSLRMAGRCHLTSVEDPLNLCGMIRTEPRDVMQPRWLLGKVRKKWGS